MTLVSFSCKTKFHPPTGSMSVSPTFSDVPSEAPEEGGDRVAEAVSFCNQFAAKVPGLGLDDSEALVLADLLGT